MPDITPESWKTLIWISFVLVGAFNLMLMFRIRAGHQPVKKLLILVGVAAYISAAWWWVSPN